MPPAIPDEVPTIIVAGTTVKFHRVFDDFPPADGWAYTFYANGASNIFNQVGTPSSGGDGWDIVIPKTKTASVAPGRYTIDEVLTNAGTGEEVHPSRDLRQLQIEANVSTAAAGAFVSHVERTLAIIEAAIEGKLTGDMVSYQIAGRAVVLIQPKELLWFRGLYASKLYQLQNPGSLGPTATIAFTNQPEDPIRPPTWVDVTGFDA